MRPRLRSVCAITLILTLAPAAFAQGAAPAKAAPAKAAPSPAAPGKAAPAAATPTPAAVTPAATTPTGAKAPLAESLTGDAKGAYEAAKILYADGDFAGAALKFQQAYALSSDPRLLWNAAAAEKNQRHYARVEKLIGEYLAKGGASSEAERADAQALIETVHAFIADVTLSVNEAGATVFVDDAAVGTTPLSAPLRLDMGPRRLRVAKPGFKEFTVTQEIVGGSPQSLDVVLQGEQHEGRLRVVGGVNSTIRVDGKLVGLGQWEGTLPSGGHSVEVTADRKLPYRADSLVQDGQLTSVQVALQDEPAPTTAVASPRNNSTWLWVSGGIALAAGLGVGGYFLFKPSNQGPPAPVEGSLGSVQLSLRSFGH
jgi:hypothetical protein